MNELTPSRDFPSPVQTGGVVPLLLTISKSTRAFLALLLAEIGLHPGQDQLLHRLTAGQAVSVSALADQLAVRPSTVSKMLDRLIEKKLVLRTTSSGDARRTMVLLTEEGATVRTAVLALWERLETELVATIPDGNRRELIGALAQVDTLLATRLRRLR
ncbi:MarR family winged helix-turn-helix transcriptional regulator [Aureimonas populi]|uniref:MarR family winged helix-turn-helix transcriptional regulator n=1 Tax=Aureimonas populi TaxID=1701758 RepID=A0ABW5CN92_9HYPH|nr:MarR family winged helix-turn-helix transcriptional regulator [Aureimonas populi]